jgi:ribosomal protein L29
MSVAEEIRSMTDEALTHQMFDAERELVQVRFQHSMGALENTSQIGILRKQIARIQGEARNREIAQGLRKGALIQSHRATYKAGVQPAPEGDASTEGGFLQGIVDKLTTKE